MNIIKKIVGIVLFLLAPSAVFFMVTQALEKISLAATSIEKTNTMLQWSIILLIFIPICAGLALFGYYSIKGEYDRLPSSSEEL
jgi:hypothetical protein